MTLSINQIEKLNKEMKLWSAERILQWAIRTFPGLYQTTAFGLTGLVTIDMLSQLGNGVDEVPLIFIDTLHHFEETHELVRRVQAKYDVNLHIYKPQGSENAEEFNKLNGDKLWETNEMLYDFLVKVEPAQRAYSELKVNAVLTGRRKSQGGARSQLPVIEVEEVSGVIKINPLHNWTFQEVKEYIKLNNVPYNALLDQGYKSIGDWHSTVPVGENEDERSGRWKGQAKTECGIHQVASFNELLRNDVKAS